MYLSSTPLRSPTSAKDIGLAEPIHASSSSDEVELVEINTIPSIHRVGFPEDHISKLAALSAARQEIFAIRPVDPANKSLIEAGYPTKNLTIKSKSANWGPMAGFLPANQGYSKLEAQLNEPHSQATVQKYQAEMDKLLSGHHAKKDTLKISHNRIVELIEGSHGKMECTRLDADVIRIHARGPSGCQYEFEAVKTTEGQFAILQNGEPFEVLCDIETGLPIIADYDLLLCAPLLAQLGGLDSVQEHHPDARWDSVKELLHDQKTEYPKGDISRRIADLADEINARLGRSHNKLVHHGADQHNTHTELAVNFPATFFLPEPLGDTGVSLGQKKGAVVVIEDVDQLKSLIEVAKDHGYHFDFFSAWSPDVRSVKRSVFKEALERFEQGNEFKS